MIRSVPRPAKAASRPRSLKLRLTDMEFCAWVAQAEAGDRLEYHRGFLARNTYRLDSNFAEADRAAIVSLRDRARWAAEKGLVHLVQERLGPNLFAYVAIARARREHGSTPLSALLLADAA
jgi:hypothetical protein